MTPDCQFWWNWWVNFGVAFGTLFLAFVALFGDKVRARFFPPKLVLTIKSNEGEMTQLTDAQGRVVDDTRYYYVLVSNQRRWSPAEETQVFLTRLETPGPSEDLQILWFGEIPIRWRNQEFVPPLRTVGPNIDCDFCRVEKNGKRLALLPLVPANNLPTIWQGPCTFVATLQARSSVRDSEMLRVMVAWDGGWKDGVEEMKKHLVVRPA